MLASQQIAVVNHYTVPSEHRAWAHGCDGRWAARMRVRTTLPQAQAADSTDTHKHKQTNICTHPGHRAQTDFGHGQVRVAQLREGHGRGRHGCRFQLN